MRDTTERVYQAICQFWLENHYGPGTRELARMTGLASTSTVNLHLNKLQKAGRIQREVGQSRTARPVNMEVIIDGK